MSRLMWNQAESKNYEFGVDRGVFYPNDGPGVAWHGLTSFSESYDGGEIVPIYIDGVKRTEIVMSKDFQGRLFAFSKPKEFGPCDGEQELVPGFIITGQLRETFGFSYRVSVSDGSYKIGLVWNATATRSQHDNQTVGDTVNPVLYEWQINAVPPPAASGYRPTAHMIVDSNRYGVNALAALLDILYGTDTSSPRLPTQSEIVQLLSIGSVVDGGTPTALADSEVDGGETNSTYTETMDGGMA